MSLYNTIRPSIIEDVIGQPWAVAQVEGWFNKTGVPHSVLLAGPSGTGKTTIARILAKAVGSQPVDIVEKNCASDNGVDMIRSIESNLPFKQLSGNPKVYIIDECHQLTTQAQRAFLKVLEEERSHVYFFLCTTNPEKLEGPLKTRCSQITLKEVPTPVILSHLRTITTWRPDLSLPDAILVKIAAAASGSVRKALVLLEQIAATGPDHADEILADDGEIAPDLFQIIKDYYAGKNVLTSSGAVLGALDDSQVEVFRRSALGYGAAILKNPKTKPDKGKEVCGLMQAFKTPFWNSGKNGLILAIAEVTYGV